ncbi:MAG TPA: type IV pilus assembly protein PilM [Bacillota bacterium]|jgi:type IV pilus assembly protein PilM|nr:type IV pilus assembly protein PilM [Bacillota bacterium]HOJ85157.1 type IV pilus assembly protein PilM [Bacillota bacterium]HOL16224.1 type IV pilus assembly protein PilM [Bacillota bacterium]HPU00481.1 type IV pilus assembly protein PilM [Bacillota bacterium]HPZ10992.1 type IV pilus assembly protein PilM [Bacillota bacterium]
MDQAVETAVERDEFAAPPPLYFKGRYSAVGLDIGSEQLKLIQFKQEHGEVFLHQYGIYDLPEGAITAGRVTDAAALSDRLAWVFKRRRFHRNRVNLCIGSQAVILRQMRLPKMPPRELQAALRFEAGKEIMIPLEEAVLDYIEIGESVVDGNEVIDLAVVAAPKDVVNDYITVILKAGLYPDVIEIEPFALQRVLPYVVPNLVPVSRGEEAEALMVLDIGGECSNLLLVDQGGFSFSRTLSIGVNHFCHRIAERREIGYDAARRLLFGGDPFTVEGVQEVADELVNQIRRSLEFYLYRAGHAQKEIKTICLCGGGASIDRLPSFLGFELKVEPKILNPFSFVHIGRRFIREDLEREGHLLNIASGLALRGWLR